MTSTLTISASAFRQAVRALHRAPGRPLVWRAGLACRRADDELLVHDPRPLGIDSETAAVLVLGARGESPLVRERARDLGTEQRPAAWAVVDLTSPDAPWEGEIFAGLRHSAFDRVRVIGPGLPLATAQVAEPWPAPCEAIWSRTIGALGVPAWATLRSARVAIVGCSRNGSLVADGLVRLGVRRLALVDPDILELHNLGEMDLVTAQDVGLPKAAALAVALTVVDPLAGLPDRPSLDLEVATQAVLSLSGIDALRESDLIVSAVDNAPARRATQLLAALYLRPLLDIGTGLLRGDEAEFAGADVRLILPETCLGCFGGWAETATETGDWQQERRGSLRSLNAVAVNYGLRLLEDLAAGRLRASTWLHLDWDANGLPSLTHRQAAAAVREGRRNCPVCGLAGSGDAGIGRIPGVLAEMAGLPGPADPSTMMAP